MTFANNQEDEEDLHAEEDGEGIADEPGHPETKQRETLLSAAKPEFCLQPRNNLLFSLLIVTTGKCIFHSISKHHLLYKVGKLPQISFMRKKFIFLWLMESHFQQFLGFSCFCPFLVV